MYISILKLLLGAGDQVEQRAKAPFAGLDHFKAIAGDLRGDRRLRVTGSAG